MSVLLLLEFAVAASAFLNFSLHDVGQRPNSTDNALATTGEWQRGRLSRMLSSYCNDNWCREWGSYDSDCCAWPRAASCAYGTKIEGEVCYGSSARSYQCCSFDDDESSCSSSCSSCYAINTCLSSCSSSYVDFICDLCDDGLGYINRDDYSVCGSSSDDDDDSSNVGAIVGGVIGGMIFLALAIFCCCMIFKREKNAGKLVGFEFIPEDTQTNPLGQADSLAIDDPAGESFWSYFTDAKAVNGATVGGAQTEKCPGCYCVINWLFCFVLFLYRIFCIACCCCYCCCLCCPKKSKLCCPKKSKRTEREARNETQEDQEALNDWDDDEEMMELTTRRHRDWWGPEAGSAAGVGALTDKNCTGLTALNLFHCDEMDSARLVALARKCPGLIFVDIGRTNADNSAVEGLAKSCRGLRKVILFATKVDNTAVKVLAQHCTDLEAVDLSHTPIDNAAVEMLAKHCTGLTTVQLAGTNVDNFAVNALAKHCKSLAFVDLSNTQVDNYGIEVLAKNCTDLRAVDVTNTRVDSAGLRVLAAHCPGLLSVETVSTEEKELELSEELPEI